MKRFLQTASAMIFVFATIFAVIYFGEDKNFGFYVGLFGGILMGLMIMEILHEVAHDWLFPKKKKGDEYTEFY